MFDSDQYVKIKAWGPFNIYMYGYKAPDIKTGALVYLSIVHGLLMNIVLNNIAFFSLQDNIPAVFKITFAVSLLYGAIFAFTKVGKSKNHTLREYSKARALAEICAFSVMLFCIYLMTFNGLYVSMRSGFNTVYIIYCVVHPLILYPLSAVVLANIIANFIRLFSRSV